MTEQTTTYQNTKTIVSQFGNLEKNKIISAAKRICKLENFNVLLLVVIILGGVFYIASINDLTVKGFRLQELKQEAYTKDSELKEMENKAMELESFNYLSKKAEELGMVAVKEEIAYLEVKDSAVAVNK